MIIGPVAAVVGLALATAAADYLLKRASQTESIHWGFFSGGCLIYAATAFGWLYAMRHLKLATLGVVYAVLIVLFMVFLGVVLFKEPINRAEILGICLAIIALTLLARYS